MLILTMRTDKPEAELGLFDNGKKIAYETRRAHRQLAETIHLKIKDLLESNNYTLEDANGILIFRGPGSFTGLRIGISVANALADGLQIPIVGEDGDNWLKKGLQKVQKGENEGFVLPEYGSPPHITKPKH